MPNVQDVLGHKGNEVASVDRHRTVIEAAREMNRRRIGSLVVLEGKRVVGIFTGQEPDRQPAGVPGTASRVLHDAGEPATDQDGISLGDAAAQLEGQIGE